METRDHTKLKHDLMRAKGRDPLRTLGGFQISMELDDDIKITQLRVELISVLVNRAPKQVDIAGDILANLARPLCA